MSGAMPYFGDAYMADTRHLTLEEHGAYHLLLLIAWRLPDCALPDDDKRIAQMLSITPKKWAALKPSVLSFWSLSELGWTQKRQAKERRWVDEKSRKNRAAAEASHRSRSGHPPTNPFPPGANKSGGFGNSDEQDGGAKSLENNDADDANADADAQANAGANGGAPPPPPLKKGSVDKSTAQSASDLVRELFNLGIAILTEAGCSEARARSLIGKWRKSPGDGRTMSALLECQAKAITEPVEWLTKRLAGAQYVSESGFEYRGDDEAVMKQAEKRADWSTYWAAKANLEGRSSASASG